MKNVKWTINSVLNWTQKYLQNTRPSSSRLDAELLLAFVLGCNRLDLYLRADQPLNPKELRDYRELIRHRSIGCPVAYLTGEKEFWSLKLEVNKNTLIPRPDTETLVEHALNQIRNWQKKNPKDTCKIVELGTGTAAIPLALCSELKNLKIISVDCNDLLLDRSLIGAYHGTARPRVDFQWLLDLIKNGRLNLDTLISKERPLEEVNQAFEDMNAGIVARSILTFN